MDTTPNNTPGNGTQRTARDGESTGHPISAYDVPNVLAFLSWHVPLEGAIPNSSERDSIECGRAAIFDACRAALLAEEARHD